MTPLPLPQHPNRCGLSENQKKGLDDKRIINISLKRCSFQCTRGDALPRHRLQIARWRAIICRGAQAAALHAADAPLECCWNALNYIGYTDALHDLKVPKNTETGTDKPTPSGHCTLGSRTCSQVLLRNAQCPTCKFSII